MCGKLTTRVLFGDNLGGIYVCSRGCELEYFESLRHRKKEPQNLLRYLDEKIARTKTYSRVGWASAVIGIVWIILGAFLTHFSVTKNPETGVSLFFIGVFVTACSALSTCYLDDRERKLTETRRRLA